jgi:hypothetical protein
LQLALSRVEKVRRMIENLQELKARGEVEPAAYDQFLARYNALHTAATENVRDIREQIQAGHDKLVADEQGLAVELQNVQLRARVGEIPPDQVPKAMGSLQKKREALAARIAQLKAALAAASVDDLGGYVPDVDVNARIEYATRALFSPGAMPPLQWFERLQAAAAPHLPWGEYKRNLQVGAAIAFCVACLFLLGRALAYYKAGQMVGGVEGLASLFGAPKSVLKQAGGVSSGGAYFSCFLTLVVGVGLGFSIFAYFTSKPWADAVAFFSCAGTVLVSLIIALLLRGILGAIVRGTFFLPEIICLYGVFASLVPASGSSRSGRIS